MSEEHNSSRQIISILASATPSHGLKEVTYSALNERMLEALNGYKKMIAQNYLGQGLEEGIISQYKQSAADRRAGENRPEDDDEYGPGPWPKKKKHLSPDAAKYGSHKGSSPEKETARRLNKEDTDLQEISKKTLGSYIKKASHDITVKGAATREFANRSREDRKNDNFVGARKNMELSDKTFAKSWKRRTNMAKAVDRLTKEDK